LFTCGVRLYLAGIANEALQIAANCC